MFIYVPSFFVWSIQKENDGRKPQRLVGYLSHLNQGMGELYLVGGTPFVCVDSGGKATKTVIHIYLHKDTYIHITSTVWAPPWTGSSSFSSASPLGLLRQHRAARPAPRRRHLGRMVENL